MRKGYTISSIFPNPAINQIKGSAAREPAAKGA